MILCVCIDRILKGQIENWIEAANVPKDLKAKIVIVPHAGYRYSGGTAAYAYKMLKEGEWKRIIVLGPSHRSHLSTTCQISSFEVLDTPLGPLATSKVESQKGFRVIDSNVDLNEHSLEMQYPFIKYILPDVKLIPLLVGDVNRRSDDCIAMIAAELERADTAMVISSDFCHWGSNYNFYPKLEEYEGKSMSDRIDKMNREGTFAIESKDPAMFRDYLKRTSNTICGCNPILLCMQVISHMALDGNWVWLDFSQSTLIKEYNSQQSSVSYIAGAYCVNERDLGHVDGLN
jgi:hypothetical protein